YGGRFILRFDDTDPQTPGKRPEKIFYKWIEEDLKWVGAKPDLVVYASDRLETYYELCFELLQKGFAYVCTCKSEEWRKLRDRKEPCPCRDLDPEENMKRWKKMHDLEYREGEAVVRIKTDIKHKNPAVRDWPAFRIIENPQHPRIGNDYKVWPLYNFASAVDDHLLGVTLVIRGQEHSTNTEKHKFLYQHFGWEFPKVIHIGRILLEGVVLSTSKARKGIEEGLYSGWADPRLGTLRALRRRGFKPEAIVKLMEHLGVKSSDSMISMKNLEAINRQIVDKEANRYYFVDEPVEIRVKNPIKVGKVLIPLHPERDEKRSITVSNRFLITSRDFKRFRGKEVRLKGLYNIKLSEVSEATGEEIVQEMPKIHWVPVGENLECEVVMPDNTLKKGLVEKGVLKERVGSVMQFERFGFVRLDSKKPLRFYFTHP
ncbi:MAG: glutamate--tRNA ligase, partial [Candidatus Aenigmatarchaeota archaeon]